MNRALTTVATYALGTAALLAIGHWIGWWSVIALLGYAIVDTAACAWLVLWRRV